jgi:hypothetical protein
MNCKLEDIEDDEELRKDDLVNYLKSLTLWVRRNSLNMKNQESYKSEGEVGEVP